jgi:PAS domain S-box-containing protein
MTGGSLTPQAAREELYDIIRGDGSFATKAEAVLDIGVRFLNADSGYLARVDAEAEYWEILVSTESFDGEVPTGQGIDFEISYCRRTLDAADQIALHDAPNQGWADDPAFQAQGFHCYHGTTLIVDGEPYGTVCFVAEDPREQFSDCESMFAELIARLLERELERQQHETELTRQANLATVLNRVLRHNLRNKLSVVRGHTQLMADSLDGSGEIALKSVDNLIELCEKARELDQIISLDADPEPTDITALAESVAETVVDQYPRATVAVDHEGSVTASVLPSFERALRELIENAAKHGGDDPSITIRIEDRSDGVELRVTDDGPGLAPQEAKVLETGSETPLTHGSGLGLWISHWIVTGHDGSIDATVTDTGTTMTISLPKEPGVSADSQRTTLKRAHDQYQAAFEEASDAMVIVDTEGRIIEANPAVTGVYGVESQQLLGRSIADFLPESFDFEAAWRRFQTREAEHDTVTIVGGDGVDRHVEYTGTTNIVPGHHLIVGRDISAGRETDLRS